MRPIVSEADLQVMVQRMKQGRGSTDARRTTATSGSSCKAAIQQTNSRRGESAPSAHHGYRSKLEETWSYKLVLEKHAGLILGWSYEPLNLRLPGKKNFYKPDFLVWTTEGLTFYEIKGRNKSDDRSLVKIKTAAGITPWAKFVLVRRINGRWDERPIK